MKNNNCQTAEQAAHGSRDWTDIAIAGRSDPTRGYAMLTL